MSEERIELLLRLYINSSASESETRELFSLLERAEDSPSVRGEIMKFWDEYDFEKQVPPLEISDIYQTIVSRTPAGSQKTINWLARLMVAASLILVIFGVWFFGHRSGQQQILVNITTRQTNIIPGGNRAVLTLGNGTKIILDSISNGVLFRQAGTTISKTGTGVLAYQGNKTEKSTATQYNTLSTPRGGQFQLVLADGTKVWLNAASSIQYPIAFTDKERKVVITGEAYFEVAHNDRKPFIVSVNNLAVKDIGTHFNINAYKDEPGIVTTLLEGAVQIEGHTIRAGEKAIASSGTIQVMKGNPEQAIAWKNGFFYFLDADLQTVMRQLSRWYNIDVTYESKVPERQFDGMIGRSLTLDQVLKGLTKERVHYSIRNGNQLIIKP
jgi:transmembrane sensor